ncbi:hypothetical protein M0R45_034406 [Rubus argutus]|uniref:Uncharacterized protein n=1 Tax=Rubus argutus TaxID=59490 RepID=A0AAW1VRU4_RUBAR
MYSIIQVWSPADPTLVTNSFLDQLISYQTCLNCFHYNDELNKAVACVKGSESGCKWCGLKASHNILAWSDATQISCPGSPKPTLPPRATRVTRHAQSVKPHPTRIASALTRAHTRIVRANKHAYTHTRENPNPSSSSHARTLSPSPSLSRPTRPARLRPPRSSSLRVPDSFGEIKCYYISGRRNLSREHGSGMSSGIRRENGALRPPQWSQFCGTPVVQ